MKEFLLIFRENTQQDADLSPDQLQNISKPWQDWMGDIAAQDKLSKRGNRLDSTGKVVKSNNVTDGPYVEMKEAIGGYTLIKASDISEATELAKGCPALSGGGSVEVRPIVSMNLNN